MNPHVAVPWHPSPSLTLGGSRPQSLSGRLPALFVSASEGASRCTHSRSLPRRVPRLRSGLRRDVGAVCAKPPSNKRLKLVGTNRRTGSGVLCPGGHELSFNTTAPCRRVARDFKRDPLGRLAPCLVATALQLRSRRSVPHWSLYRHPCGKSLLAPWPRSRRRWRGAEPHRQSSPH